jgi:hypothetical protein
MKNKSIPIINELCISIMHFLQEIAAQQLANYNVNLWSSDKLSKNWCCIITEITVTRQKHLAVCEDQSNTYKMMQSWRWYPQTIHVISELR